MSDPILPISVCIAIYSRSCIFRTSTKVVPSEKPHSDVLEYLTLTFSKLLIVSNFMNFRSFEMPTFDSILKTTHWRIAASFVFWVWYFACQMYFECVSNHRDLSDVQNSSQCRIRTVEDFGNKMRGSIIFTNQGEINKKREEKHYCSTTASTFWEYWESTT